MVTILIKTSHAFNIFTKLQQGNVLHLSVSHSVHRGDFCHTPAGRHPTGKTPPWADTLSADTPQADTPGQTTPLGRHPQADTPRQTPLLRSACWDMVNKRAVCILLECILVHHFFDADIL